MDSDLNNTQKTVRPKFSSPFPSKLSIQNLLSMASPSIPTLLLTLLFFALLGNADNFPEIKSACQASQYPSSCIASLLKTPLARKRPGAQTIVKTAMGLSLGSVQKSYYMTESILSLAQFTNNFNLTVAARNGLEALNSSMRTISRSMTVSLTVGRRVKDARAWMSAALTYEEGCFSGFNRLNRSDLASTIRQINAAMNLTSTALSMVAALDTYGADIESWRPPETERSANFSVKISSDEEWFRELQQLKKRGKGEVVANVTVSTADDGSEYSSIQAAVDDAPDYSTRVYVIRIKAGVYQEIVRVPPNKINLMWVGEGMDRTIVTGSLNAQQPGVGTYGSATVGVNADGFVARDMAFENSAGPEMIQAVALRVDSDLSAFERCAFLGHQDTLYAHSLRQFYVDCNIQGTVDFIFGNAAAVFRNTTILVRPRALPSKGGDWSPVSAQGRSDPAQSTGFVFDNCIINGTEEYMRDFYANPEMHRAVLGRPWRAYSRSVYMRSYMGPLISPEGWMAWEGSFALATLFYGEFGNYGEGGNVSGRVAWSSQISPLAVGMYSVRSFIQADRWLPFLVSNYFIN